MAIEKCQFLVQSVISYHDHGGVVEMATRHDDGNWKLAKMGLLGGRH